MPNPSTRQVLRRHAVAFTILFVSLTALLVANYATKQVPELLARGVPAGTILEAMLLAVPFTAAITIPMAVLIAVLWAAAVVAAVTLVSNAEILPRANERLATVLEGAHEPGDREMTIGALREASRSSLRTTSSSS